METIRIKKQAYSYLHFLSFVPATTIGLMVIVTIVAATGSTGLLLLLVVRMLTIITSAQGILTTGITAIVAAVLPSVAEAGSDFFKAK